MSIKCAYCGKDIDVGCMIKDGFLRRQIDFCSYEHYLKFWRGTRGFVPFLKSQAKKIKKNSR